MLYAYTDYLGSITHITDGRGRLIEEHSYDAWGRHRDPETWQVTDMPENNLINERGYTGHEMLSEFALINMNGRMYDPVVGRMLSPDNYVQMPDYSQNFNRYSYCFNNPLKYTDPSGDLVFAFPYVSWSKSGGFSAGITVGVGIPKVLSVSASLGYNFKQNEINVSVGASAAFFTMSLSWAPSSGTTFGFSAGFGGTGSPISTNLLSAGIYHNFRTNSISGNISMASISEQGVSFEPSVSYTMSNWYQNTKKAVEFLSQIQINRGKKPNYRNPLDESISPEGDPNKPEKVNLKEHPVTDLVEWFSYIEKNDGVDPVSGKQINVADIIDASSMPKKHYRSFGSMTNNYVDGYTKFGKKDARWFIVDRDFLSHPSEVNDISYIKALEIGNKYYFRAMFNNETRITLTFYDYDLYKTMYNRIYN